MTDRDMRGHFGRVCVCVGLLAAAVGCGGGGGGRHGRTGGHGGPARPARRAGALSDQQRDGDAGDRHLGTPSGHGMVVVGPGRDRNRR